MVKAGRANVADCESLLETIAPRAVATLNVQVGRRVGIYDQDRRPAVSGEF